jgi:hypothetical protein
LWCRNLTLRKYENEIHTLEMGIWESSGTLEILEFDCKGQNTSHWGVFYIIGKLLKCRCRRWARWTIWTSATQVMAKTKVESQTTRVKLAVWFPTIKSRRSTQPKCVQVECNTPLESSQQELQVYFRPRPN